MQNTTSAPSAPTGHAPDAAVIRNAKRQLEQMIDANPHTMLLVDRQQRISRANRAFLDLTGLSRYDEALGHPLPEFFPCRDTGFFDRLFSDGDGYAVCENRVDFPNRPQRIVRFTVIGSGRDTEWFAVMAHDITAESNLDCEREQAQKKEAVQTLMGALMHRINQPLTVIMVRAQLMQLALERNRIEPDDFAQSLRDIMKLTMDISRTLQSMEKPVDYATEPYMPGIDILDLERSGTRPDMDTYSKALVDVFLVALDAHCPGATLHANRTDAFAGFLAEKAGWTPEETTVARRCGFFHDLGKIGVPDHILQKPGALTHAEAETMRRHTETGHDLLRSFPLLQREAETAWSHHERYDGTGYPRGLKGADIPQISRLVALADAFDALRYDRAYQQAMPLDQIEAIVRTGRGTQFDPDFADILLSCHRDMDALFAEEKS